MIIMEQINLSIKKKESKVYPESVISKSHAIGSQSFNDDSGIIYKEKNRGETPKIMASEPPPLNR